jgi:hypothetical protein
MNMAWTDVPQLSKPARSFVFGPRFGKNFKINKTKTPEQSIAVWVGAFRVGLKSETNGSLSLSEVFNIDEIGGKVDQGLKK